LISTFTLLKIAKSLAVRVAMKFTKINHKSKTRSKTLSTRRPPPQMPLSPDEPPDRRRGSRECQGPPVMLRDGSIVDFGIFSILHFEGLFRPASGYSKHLKLKLD
jgi:hypothetical protein